MCIHQNCQMGDFVLVQQLFCYREVIQLLNDNNNNSHYRHHDHHQKPPRSPAITCCQLRLMLPASAPPGEQTLCSLLHSLDRNEQKSIFNRTQIAHMIEVLNVILLFNPVLFSLCCHSTKAPHKKKSH